jgi:hypothetical protein
MPKVSLPQSPVRTNTLAPTPFSTDWEKYFSEEYGFEFKYPKEAILSDQSAIRAHFNLPITSGTNLSQKYLDMSILEGASTCKSPNIRGTPAATETVTINGVEFLKESGDATLAGNRYDYIAYSSMLNNNCVSLTFVLHSLDTGNFLTPPPEFNKVAESAIFDLIINTFDWTG